MADNARGIHVSPGIYTREIDMTYAVKSLGITSLGLAGETLKGPAFQPMDISNWREFQDMFGGTSTEKFKGSQYPKYELPYIAKSYLSESEQLKVVRVLGLSGYNAGPAWVVTASNGGTDKYAVAVIRSRGYYDYYNTGKTDSTTNCACEPSKYDKLHYFVGEKLDSTDPDKCEAQEFNMEALKIAAYTPINGSVDMCTDYKVNGGDTSTAFNVSQTNRGRFKLCGLSGKTDESVSEGDTGKTGYFEYAVSLNPNDKEYILNVLGTKAYDGDAPIYVESLYDVALVQGIADNSITKIDDTLAKYQVYNTADYCGHEPVFGIMNKPQEALTRKDVGRRYLADANAVSDDIKCVLYNYTTGEPVKDASGKINVTGVTAGQIYTVRQYTANDKRHYYYTAYSSNTVTTTGKDDIYLANVYGSLKGGGINTSFTRKSATLVLNNADGLYYRYSGGTVVPVTLDMNDYKSAYRYASTPWIVSNLKGDYKHMELTKLFRFHTISDGDSSNYEVKVSIENIRPDEGTFDVVVRRIDDLDESIIPLERFGRCTMNPGDSNYIAYKIGSFDGIYESKSKYITVEVNETTAARTSVPAGFLGYPVPQYSGVAIDSNPNTNVKLPTIRYNTTYDEDIKNKKQYFGLSSWVGVDIDNFTFKGNKAYINIPDVLSQGFHLDSRLDLDAYPDNEKPSVTVDNEPNYKFDTVSVNARTQILDGAPIIGREVDMYGSIYQYVNLRKFTVFFYGGFDGWDVYRDQRSNTDNFKMTQYKGFINQNSGEGYSFNKIHDPEALGLNQNGITSDWYAYLAGIRQFANPEATDINVFATPGIDYVNQTLLVEEAIEMIEEERADSIYVTTTPDKPSGAGDYVDEMYTPEDVVGNLEDTEIDSNYTCTYYPWVKYLDIENNQYIYLPPTKDVVRNFAQTDNTSFPWFAPAGIERGGVDCVRAHYITKLADEDTLYEGRINPIKTFAQDGVKIWGQKNLQINESQLNRIAVRRLLLRMRKLIAIACIGLIFEPNDATTKQSFISTVTPILDSIRSNRGISDYRIEVNDSIESRERRELPVKIYFKPYNALEYISIDFILTPEGVSFDDI